VEDSTTRKKVFVWKELARLLEQGPNPTIGDKRGILPLEKFNNPHQSDPTAIFLLIRSMVELGFR